MTDAEIRDRLLPMFYELRHSNGGWVPTSDINMSPHAVSPQVIGGVCQHLADVGLIHWKPLTVGESFILGMAKITGKGVATIEARGSPDIEEHGAAVPGRLSPAPSVALAPTASEQLTGQVSSTSSASPETAPPQLSPVEVKKNELLTLKPTLWGISIDLKEAGRRLRSWWNK